MIIKNRKNELLLQLRDEEPEIGKYVLFGGGVKVGETSEMALAREIKEELDYEIKFAKFFGDYEDNGIKQTIYFLNKSVELEDLNLYEGAAMKFFAPADLGKLNIGFNFRQILADHLSKTKN